MMGRSNQQTAASKEARDTKRSSKDDRDTQVPLNITADSVYDFYKHQLFPALAASLPLLCSRIFRDVSHWLGLAYTKTVHFLLPWTSEDWNARSSSLVALWEHSNATLAEFMLRHFDTNADGHFSPHELLNMTELLETLRANTPRHSPRSILAWFSSAWPMLDFKIGVFLWNAFGGLLISLAIMSIVPGRLHGYAGRILRWPILGITYFMISVELVVYVLIRVFIRLVEVLIASPKHRKLRRQIAQAQSYEEWYSLANELDISQKRDFWRHTTHDDTSYRYNWSFIKELMHDLDMAREKGDSLMALAVLQQCTRKNVGGIMSEEIFSYTNTGEPKEVVREFIEDVVATLRWVTDEALLGSSVEEETAPVEKKQYEQRFQRKVAQEKNKMWSSLISWATLNFQDDDDAKEGRTKQQKPVKRSMSVPTVIVENLPQTRSLNALQSSTSSHGSPSSSHQRLPSFHKEQLIAFLKRARAAYGRTALCLSGGAMMGNYHWGHAKALLENGALPHIISGTSAGSVVAAILCTRTDEEIERDMTPEVLSTKLKCFRRPWPERIKSVWRTGHLFDYEEWYDMIQWFTCGDLTFEEAYKKTGRIFCITLSATTKKAPPVLLNHISAPNVVIGSAVVASAAVPGFIPPVRLRVKDPDGTVRERKDQLYWDGSIEQDIPISGLAEMLNTQFFVAAQCNPHIVPFFYNSKGDVGRPSRWSSGMRADSWRGGFLLSALELYLKSDMRAKMNFLNDVEAAVGFTATLYAQQHYGGSTTIVPQISLIDFFKLFSDPTYTDLNRYFQAGQIAAYQHVAMIKLHYQISDALDECLERLENSLRPTSKIGTKPARLLATKAKTIKELDGQPPPHRFSVPAEMTDGGLNMSQSETSESTDDLLLEGVGF